MALNMNTLRLTTAGAVWILDCMFGDLQISDYPGLQLRLFTDANPLSTTGAQVARTWAGATTYPCYIAEGNTALPGGVNSARGGGGATPGWKAAADLSLADTSAADTSGTGGTGIIVWHDVTWTFTGPLDAGATIKGVSLVYLSTANNTAQNNTCVIIAEQMLPGAGFTPANISPAAPYGDKLVITPQVMMGNCTDYNLPIA